MNNGRKSIVTILSALAIVTVPAASRAASIGLGASVWCAWWESMVPSQASLSGGSSGIEPVPAAAGGPNLSVQFNDTWGLNLSYLYGKFKLDKSSPLIGYKMEAARHDLDFIVSAAVHRYVRIYFGAKYWGYMVDMRTNLLFFSYGSRITRHQGGPGLGLGLTLPLGAGFHLLPNVSGVFMFGTIDPQNNGLIGQAINRIFKSTDTNSVVMYYGINATLSLAYHIEKANLTLAIGGRFQYLWLYLIESESTIDSNDMFAGINFSAMYMFDIPGQGKKG
ncbi:MAG TPA: hypothetical protein PK307_16885 [Spirochaetota bacterium]|nr:hypothetical protein [Spirochaetota bacterium]